MESIVSTIQVAKRKCGTIKKSAGELYKKEVPRRASRSSRSQSCKSDCAVAWEGWEVTVDVNVHDKNSNL